MQSKFLFVVTCERIGRRQAYYIDFPYNEQIVGRIKKLPEETRKWNGGLKKWEITTQSLFKLIKSYKNSDKIFFDFGDENSRNVFKEQVNKIKLLENKKREEIILLNKKKEKWIEYKKELENNYEKYWDECHSYLNENVKLYPHQIVAALFINSTRNALISHEMGLGKAQDLDSLLLTPNGWIRMGDVNVGDYVIGYDGLPKKVTGVYPQGLKDIYEIEFSDGTIAKSCLEHYWKVKNINNSKYVVKTLEDIINFGIVDNNNFYCWEIPMIKPISFEKRNLLIKPYNLGLLLYCGDFNQKFLKISDGQIEASLKFYELHKINSKNSFIPNDYMYSNIDDRFELLNGLLENCEYIHIRNEIIFESESTLLIKDVQFVVESLGGIGKIVDDKLIRITLPFDFMPKKIKNKYKFIIQPYRLIVDVKYIGKKESQCISVDCDNHLYATNHCILTHNTLSSILYVEMNKFERVVVITPNSLKFNYLNEVKKFTKSNAFVVNYKKNDCDINEAKYIIINYDFFNPSNKTKFDLKWNKLNINNIDVLICDESQKLKNTKTNIYKNFKRIFKEGIFKNKKVSKLFLSGTPAPNRAYELYTVLNQISSIDFPTKKYFYEYYCGMTYDFENGWGYVQNTMEQKFEELYYKIAPYTHRKRKFEVLNDLPDKIYQRIVLELTNDELSTYNKIEQDVVNDFIDKPSYNPLTIMLRLRQYLSEVKIKHIIELVENIIETGEKVIIMDYFKESLYELKKYFGNLADLHTGNQSIEERSDVVNSFQDPNNQMKIFLGTIQTSNYGLTLTAASKLFIMTLPYSVGEYDQAADRCHRIGQKDVVNIYPLIFLDTIDDYVYSKIETKREEIIKVLDNEKYTSNVEESVLSDVIEKIKSKYGK